MTLRTQKSVGPFLIRDKVDDLETQITISRGSYHRQDIN